MDARISLRLPTADADRLERLAASNRHSLGAEVRAAIARHLERAEVERAVAAMSDHEIEAFLLGRGVEPALNDRQEPRQAPVGKAHADGDGEARGA